MRSFKSIVLLVLCLLLAGLSAQPTYPPTLKGASVETYRKVDSTELKLWIFGESDPVIWAPWRAHAQTLVANGPMDRIAVEQVRKAIDALGVAA